jgi:hypothetical protein
VLVVLWSSKQIETSGGIGRPPFEVIFNFRRRRLDGAGPRPSPIALILMRKAGAYRRLTITLAQSCGFLLYFFFVRGGFGGQTPARFRRMPSWLGR